MKSKKAAKAMLLSAAVALMAEAGVVPVKASASIFSMSKLEQAISGTVQQNLLDTSERRLESHSESNLLMAAHGSHSSHSSQSSHSSHQSHYSRSR